MGDYGSRTRDSVAKQWSIVNYAEANSLSTDPGYEIGAVMARDANGAFTLQATLGGGNGNEAPVVNAHVGDAYVHSHGHYGGPGEFTQHEDLLKAGFSAVYTLANGLLCVQWADANGKSHKNPESIYNICAALGGKGMLAAIVMFATLMSTYVNGNTSANANAAMTADVTFNVLQCPDGRDERPDVQIAAASGYPKLHYTALPSRIGSTMAGYARLMASVPAGNYFFRVSSVHCSGSLQVGILPHHARTLSVALARRCTICNITLFSFENALMGAVPLTASVGFLVNEHGGKRVLDLQNGAYYIERVPPGQYLLRFELHGGFQSEINLDLRNIGPAQTVVYDVTFSKFVRNLGQILKDGSTWKQCDWCQ